jgi:hypothetical protein
MSENAVETAQQINKTWSVIKQDLGLTETGVARRSPWKSPSVPATLKAALEKVTFRVYNCGTLGQTFMGARTLQPRRDNSKATAIGLKYGIPLEVHETELQTSNVGEYKIEHCYTDGFQFASDVICPAGDPECDLRPWGCFFTPYEESTPEFEKQVVEAYAALHEKYSELIQIADALWDTNIQTERKKITDIYRVAAREMGIERDWCHLLRPKKSCDACLKPMDVGAIKCPHQDCGVIYDWAKARKFRLCTKEQYEEAVAEGLVEGVVPPVKTVAPKKG